MAATFMLAAGRVTPAGIEVTVDWQLAELLRWQEEERLEPLQAYIDEAQDDTFLEVMEYQEEIDWNRRGGWL